MSTIQIEKLAVDRKGNGIVFVKVPGITLDVPHFGSAFVKADHVQVVFSNQVGDTLTHEVPKGTKVTVADGYEIPAGTKGVRYCGTTDVTKARHAEVVGLTTDDQGRIFRYVRADKVRVTGFCRVCQKAHAKNGAARKATTPPVDPAVQDAKDDARFAEATPEVVVEEAPVEVTPEVVAEAPKKAKATPRPRAPKAPQADAA